MSLFDLLFIAVFLGTAGGVATGLFAAVRGRRVQARRRLTVVAVGAAAYMTVVTMVSLAAPRRVVAIGADQCADDWCLAVATIDRPDSAAQPAYRVAFKLSSRAGRVSQRERFVVAYLLDSAGRRYDAAPAAGQPPFDTLLRPLESIVTTRTFAAPAAAAGLGVVVAREGDGGFPGCCIVGIGPFYKPPIVYVK